MNRYRKWKDKLKLFKNKTTRILTNMSKINGN